MYSIAIYTAGKETRIVGVSSTLDMARPTGYAMLCNRCDYFFTLGHSEVFSAVIITHRHCGT